MSKLISKEFVSAVQNDFDNGIFKLEKYEFPAIVTFAIDCVSLLKTASGVTMILKDSVSGDYIKEWKDDVGGVLLREIKKYGDENLFELKNKAHKILLKKILDDELNEFELSGLKHVNIADSHYTIIKCVTSSDSYSTSSAHGFIDYDSNLIDESELEQCDDNDDGTYKLF